MKRSILVGYCIWLATSQAPAAPSAEQLLPAGTWLAFTVPDMAQARERSQQWPAAKLWQDPAMKPFADKFMAKWKSDIVAPLQREFGLDFAQLCKLAQGQLTLALTRTGLDEAEPNPGLLLVVDAKEQAEALTTLLDEFRKKWVDSGKAVKSVSLRGVEFTSLAFDPREIGRNLQNALPFLESDEDQEEAKPGEPIEWLIGQSGGLLLVGDHAADLEKVVARVQGGSGPGLGQDETFAADFPMLLRGALGYLWVDLGAIVQRILKEEAKGEEGAEGMTPQKLFEPLGLMGLQTFSLALHDHPEGGLVDALLRVPAAQRKGIFELFAFEGLDSDPPAFVPADVSTFFRMRWNLRETWQRVERMVTALSPQAAGVLAMVIENAGKDKDPSFDLRQNLFANLGNDLMSYAKPPREGGLAALASTPSIYLLGSPRPEQLSSALKALTSLLPMPGGLKEREFLGRTVYTLDLGQDEGQARRVHFSPSGGYVAFSMDEAMLEEFLRTSGNPGSSLRDNRALVQAAEKVGGMSTGLFGYENQRQSMRPVVESLRKDADGLGELFSKTPLSGSISGEDIKEWLDFSLLPPFDQISKYLHIEVYSGKVTPEGFRFKVHTPNPPGQ